MGKKANTFCCDDERHWLRIREGKKSSWKSKQMFRDHFMNYPSVIWPAGLVGRSSCNNTYGYQRRHHSIIRPNGNGHRTKTCPGNLMTWITVCTLVIRFQMFFGPPTVDAKNCPFLCPTDRPAQPIRSPFKPTRGHSTSHSSQFQSQSQLPPNFISLSQLLLNWICPVTYRREEEDIGYAPENRYMRCWWRRP